MAPITEDVKATNFTELLTSSTENNYDAGSDIPLSTDVPDLATLEANKKTVQRVVHEQESFWSWFCFRLCCCDGHCPTCYYGGCPDLCECVNCCSDCGDCCANCACPDCDCPVGECCGACCECSGACCECGGACCECFAAC